MSDQTRAMLHVRNPLTVVGIFAAVSEAFACVALPKLAGFSGAVFAIFASVFPFFLVSIFFYVLWKRPIVFYAPSDFREDKAFTDLFKPVGPQERQNELIEEASEAEVSEDEEATAGLQNASDRMSLVDAAERKVLSLLEKELGITLIRDMRFEGTHFIVDAIGEDRHGPVLVEVKYLRSAQPSARVMGSIAAQISAIDARLPDSVKRGAKFILAIVVERWSDSTESKVQVIFDKYMQRLDTSITPELRFFTKDDLERTAQ